MKDDKVEKLKIGRELLDEEEALKRALAYHKAGDFQAAENIYRKIYAQNQHCSDVLHLSALILYHFGDFSKAALALRRAISLNDSKPHYYYNLGLILLDEGKKEEAQECFQKSLVLNKKYRLAQIMLLEAEKI